MLLAAFVALVPAGAVSAEQIGASGPVAIEPGACQSDPFYLYHKSVRDDGSAYRCVPMVSETRQGAMGPAGPLMMETDETACRDDPFYRYHRVVHPEGPAYQCIGVWTGPSGARGPAGPIMVETETVGRDASGDPFYRYESIFIAD